MLTASPSPRPHTSPYHNHSSSSESLRSRYDSVRKTPHTGSPISKPRSSHVYSQPAPQPAQSTSQSVFQCPPQKEPDTSASTTSTPPRTSRPKMVDAATQYSPPVGHTSPTIPRRTPVPQVGRLNLTEDRPSSSTHPVPAALTEPDIGPEQTQPTVQQSQSKRHASDAEPSLQPKSEALQSTSQMNDTKDHAPVKRPRPEGPPVKIMPLKYENCEPQDLVVLISSMLMELIRYNDAIPLRDGSLTRFHSRAPPTISVIDYLQRLTTHATLSPPILLSIVYYIDKLCALYPSFTISSLTVHRFLITGATVASKGLSDSFWTNKTYARVGGVSLRELALLELEFLVRVQWRIVPKPEVLVDYYRSLVERSPGYEIEQENGTHINDTSRLN